MTKTEKLRAALVSRGFAPVETLSSRECLKGKTTKGADLWIWLDKAGGGRYARTSKKGEAIPLQAKTVELVIAGKPSNLISGGVA